MSYFNRCLLIAFLLVVLPLRGWAGNVMAVDVVAAAAVQAAADNAAASSAQAQTQTQMPTAMLEDCAMSMQATGSDEAPVCSGCDTCELCLAVVDPKPMAWFGNRSMRHASPTAVDAAFSSAAQAFSLKPPIS